MEFNADVLKLHGAILSLGNRGLLNNTDSLETVSVFKDIFRHASSSAKSQMLFLMILNSDLTVLTHLENDENVCLFMKILPLIEKDVLVKFIFELNLQSYLYDIIKNCDSAFTSEIISVTLKNLKNSNFFKRKNGICHLYQFWTALFIKIHNINEGLHLDTGSGILLPYFRELYDHIESVLLDSFKLSESDVNLYRGTHLYNFFKQILFFLKVVNNENYKFEQDKFYDFKFKFENFQNSNVEKPSFVSIHMVLNNICKIIDCFTINFWEDLCYCFLDFDSKFSLQKLIGHIIYQICEELNSLSPKLTSNISTTILKYLSQYKIKPKSEIDVLAEESMSFIINSVDKGSERKKWFKALLHHYCCNYSLVIDCIMRNLNLADHDDINFLLENTLTLLKKEKNEKNLNHLKTFFFQLFKNIHSNKNNSYWFQKTLHLKPGLLKTDKFESQAIEIFNKLDRYFCNINNDIQRDFVSCCMQSPEEFLLKLCQNALCSRNSKQVSLCCDILHDLEYVCNTRSPESNNLKFIEEIILKIIQSDHYVQLDESIFVSFMTELLKENFFDFKFFEKILELIILYLEKCDFKKVWFLLKIIDLCQPYKLFNFNKFAFLVFISQILPLLSWKVETFSIYEPRKLCHHIINDIMKKLTDADDGVELEWVRQEILKFDEIHQAYFCDLWFKFNKNWPNSSSFMSSLLILLYASGDVESVLINQKENLNLKKPSCNIKAFLISNIEALLPHLCDECHWRRLDQILTMLLSKYWNANGEISENICVLEIFSSSMYLLALQLNENSKIYDYFKFCLKNFSSLRFFGRISENEFQEVIDFIEKITFSIQVIENDKYREICSYFIMPLILKFFDEICKEKMCLYEIRIKKLMIVLNVKFCEEITNRMSTKMLQRVEH